MKTIKEIAVALIIVMAIFSQSFYIARAQQIPSGVPFGGYVGAFVPPTSLCPFKHLALFDLVTFQIIGAAIIDGATQVYKNSHVKDPGIAVLGTYTPTPLPCLLPYPVLPVVQIATQ